MRLLIVGPQGAGKGTQAELLSENLSLPHVSTGDIFRVNVGHGTPLGTAAKSYMDRGELVPDEITNAMVADKLAEPDLRQGWLLDGFPRNLSQAKWLDEVLRERGSHLTAVLHIDVPDDVLLERMLARGRADDTAEVINRRLEIYRTETLPMIRFFGDLVIDVDGVGHFQEVQHRILVGLGHGHLGESD
jgi:adenylate kinase